METELPRAEIARLSKLACEARADVIAMTTLAGSGHPGGSLSSIDVLLSLYSYASISPATVADPNRDRIVISHGHISPAVYAVLGRLRYFDPEDAICGFRMAGSPFDGHVEPSVPGVEWACGNLGQGLSAACGFALASRLTNSHYRVYCVMGDGEQQKGQIAEARRFAATYKLANLVAIVDCNGLQAMGSVSETMPQNLAEEWSTAGWRVKTIDGHNFAEIYKAISAAQGSGAYPTVILARTVMGKSVSFIEGRYEYHGKILTREQCQLALEELNVSTDILDLERRKPTCHTLTRAANVEDTINTGVPRDYQEPTDCRTAFGNALTDLAKENPDVPIAVFDCDLCASVKTDSFAKNRPSGFLQCGIQEHSTATIAGALSKAGVLSFNVGFGVFGLDEVYNQQRLNDINDTSVKLVLTHCGLDVGEDGKTHQCIDYIALAASLYGFKLIIPADANQTDRALRYMASTPGRSILAMGRSKLPVIAKTDGSPVFAGDWQFKYGKSDWVRCGSDGVIVTTGSMVSKAVEVHEKLREQDFNVGVLSISCPLDLDEESLKQAAATGLVVTYEDHHIRTGLGSLVGNYLMQNGLNCRFKCLGVSKYGESCSPEDNYRLQGLDIIGVTGLLLSLLRREG